MKLIFDIQVKELKSAFDMPETWSDAVFRQLLQQVEYEDIDDIEPADLREMAVMALQDLKPEKAAEVVLGVLAADLSAGVRQNLAHDMKDQKMWEEFGDPEHHASIFAASVFLNWTFPKIYSRPEIARLILEVTAANPLAARQLAAPTPALAARLVAAAMDASSRLRRIYAPSLASGGFPEAATVLWQLNVREVSADSALWVMYGSWYWLRQLQSVGEYKAELTLG